MFVEERYQEILKILDQENKVFVSDLAKRFDVSIDTIRRDLAMMEGKGLLKRTHGGAIHATKVRERAKRSSVMEAENGSMHHHAIAKYAAELIENEDTVYIGGSLLHFLLVEYLPTNIPYSVVTNSILVADRLKDYDNVDVFMVCGKIKCAGLTVDAFATEFVRSLRIDTAFFAGAGISAKHGMSNGTAEAAMFAKAVSEVSRKKICLAVYDKIGKERFARSIEAAELDMLITDWDSDEEALNQIKALGVEIVVVDKPKE
jgi:DeoR/GlpR family transcriptional regulator of sugar metabolism